MKTRALRHRITIQVQPRTQDDWGEPLDQWENVWENVPAEIESLSGREFFAAQQINSEINGKITIRWRAGIDARHRAIHQTREQAAVSPQEITIYDIVAPIEDAESGRQWLTFYVINRSNPGFRSGT